jgi:hypothetical protein
MAEGVLETGTAITKVCLCSANTSTLSCGAVQFEEEHLDSVIGRLRATLSLAWNTWLATQRQLSTTVSELRQANIGMQYLSFCLNKSTRGNRVMRSEVRSLVHTS